MVSSSSSTSVRNFSQRWRYRMELVTRVALGDLDETRGVSD